MQQTRPNTISAIVQLANPVFIILVIVLPVGALVYSMNYGSIRFLNFVHIMTGALWTGIDLFMGLVLGPVLGRLEPKDRAGVFRYLVPRMTFLMPVLAAVTITSGMELAQRLGIASLADPAAALANPRILVAVIVVAILTVQGFGLLLPTEIRVFQQLLSGRPDIDKISRWGMRNARLGGVQGILQVVTIFVMASIRF